VAPGLKPELAPTRVVYPTEGSPSGRAVFQFLPRAEGYIWDFPRLGHHSVGIGVAPGTFKRDVLDGALTQYQLAETGAVDSAASDAGAVIATSAWTAGKMADLGGSDYALLGDAGGMADPATGEGIDYALRSATIAASVFTPEKGFSRYPSAIKRAFGAEFRRAKLIRRWLYHPEVAERLVARAKRSPRGALLLMALADAINNHGSLGAALWRVIRGPVEDLRKAQEACDCASGGGASARVQGTLAEATNDHGSD
jgi:flavin-dependent dehydrogenase